MQEEGSRHRFTKAQIYLESKKPNQTKRRFEGKWNTVLGG